MSSSKKPTAECDICKKLIQKQNLARHKKRHRYCPACAKMITSKSHSCTRWTWLRLNLAPQVDISQMENIDWTKAEDQCGWIPILVQSALPSGDFTELTLTTVAPEDFCPPAPNTTHLINQMRQDEKDSEEMAKALLLVMETQSFDTQDVVDMMVKRFRKQMLEWDCDGCVSRQNGQFAHMGFKGCLEAKEESIHWLETTEPFVETVRVLRLEEKFGVEKINELKMSVIEAAKARLTISESCELPPAFGLGTDVNEVAEQMVELVAETIKNYHVCFNGKTSFDQCPTLRISDINIHITAALKDCLMPFLPYTVRRELIDKVEELLLPDYIRTFMY